MCHPHKTKHDFKSLSVLGLWTSMRHASHVHPLFASDLQCTTACMHTVFQCADSRYKVHHDCIAEWKLLIRLPWLAARCRLRRCCVAARPHSPQYSPLPLSDSVPHPAWLHAHCTVPPPASHPHSFFRKCMRLPGCRDHRASYRTCCLQSSPAFQSLNRPLRVPGCWSPGSGHHSQLLQGRL